MNVSEKFRQNGQVVGNPEENNKIYTIWDVSPGPLWARGPQESRRNYIDDDSLQSIHKELTLEEVDILVRRCHHLHDEQIARVAIALCSRLGELFKARHPDGQGHPTY